MEKDVLLVDDEELVLKTLEQVFRGHGYTPHTASGGKQALEIMGRHKIQVIFLDLRMPAMDGIRRSRKIT